MSHYKWLDKNFPKFLELLGVDFNQRCPGIIPAHGDKAYGYRDRWEKYDICFNRGVAIYLLTYLRPWSSEVRNVDGSWKDPGWWVVDQYDRFKNILNKIEE